MAKVKVIFLLVCLLARFSWTDHSSRTVASLKGDEIVRLAQSQLGVRELTGRNDGLAVEAYLRYTGLGKGNPWCAAFVSWVYAQGGFARPRTAWSPALFPQNRCVKQIGKGLVYGLYDGHKGRIAHCGIATNGDGDWVVGIEGNTNLAGSAEGDGVYLKRRHRKTIYAIADWLSEKGGKDAD